MAYYEYDEEEQHSASLGTKVLLLLIASMSFYYQALVTEDVSI